MGISVPGVLRVTLSPDTQQLLGCVVGKDVTAESPWVFVNKSLIDDNMDLHSESSDFLPVRDDIAVSTLKLNQIFPQDYQIFFLFHIHILYFDSSYSNMKNP